MKKETFETLKKFINSMPDLIAAERKEVIAVLSELVDDDINKIPFEVFWEKYPKRNGKFNAKKSWSMLSAKNQKLAIDLLPLYINQCSPYILDPENYIHKRMWQDYIDNKAKTKDDLFAE